ncbi:helix-turn-helix domain-containing protein [Stenotrophomonas rhizophila]|uniref:helix-turn-helix domain-containing protein n=1 Tax=Stenotrophomonas rhizophila TaxID=216778 RepID=UPI0031BA83E9
MEPVSRPCVDRERSGLFGMSFNLLFLDVMGCELHYATSSQLEVKGFWMDIAEVAKRSGVPASALRYYEEKGLIASTGRSGLRRTFSPSVVDQLALIALGQSAGFSLDEIKVMFSADGRTNINRSALTAKADEVDATVARLKALSKGLRHAAVCPAKNHADCPTFQGLLRAAGSAKLSSPKHRSDPMSPTAAFQRSR